jgi:2-polyprenyl-3-methyl-5-hydroxy-6-metoxy-1,4-benzoquinol methylase
MFTSSRRIIEHEILDEQTPEAGERSLRDLVRINRYLGGHEATRKALRTIAPDGPFTVLDIGAGSGDAGEVIRAEYPQAQVTSLDYKLHHLRAAASPKVAGDAFRLPFRARSFDIVHCSLFLHHFTDEQVMNLLRNFKEIARIAVIVNDLERHALAYYFLPATKWLMRWDAITVHDGPISVQAAFTAPELKKLAGEAGLRDIETHVYHPAFRITLVGRP